MQRHRGVGRQSLVFGEADRLGEPKAEDGRPAEGSPSTRLQRSEDAQQGACHLCHKWQVAVVGAKVQPPKGELG